MNLLDLLLDAKGGGAASQLGRQFGLDPQQTQSALGALLPSLAGAMRQNTQRDGGMEQLMSALGKGQHGRYLDQPEALAEAATLQDGNNILGHLLGSKDVSRQVAARASQQTGIGADVLKRMLPIVATLVMGGLSKQSAAAPAATGGGLLDMLTPMLDRNQDGSALDDVLKMATGFLGRR